MIMSMMVRKSCCCALIIAIGGFASALIISDAGAADKVEKKVSEAAAEQPAAKAAEELSPIVDLLELLVSDSNADLDTAKQCLAVIAEKIQTRELAGATVEGLRPRLEKTLAPILSGKPDAPLYLDTILLAASWKNAAAGSAAGKLFADRKAPAADRLRAASALITAGDEKMIAAAGDSLGDIKGEKTDFRAKLIELLGRSEDPRVATVVLAAFPRLEAPLQPPVIELLTQRPAWSLALLEAIGRGEISTSVVNVNQVRKLMAATDPKLAALVRKHWSTVRTDRNPQREQVITEILAAIRKNPGDPVRGQAVFGKLCGQCHKIHGQGQEVGPDITVNGRASLDQLLSNVLDPSLVIGTAYQAIDVLTVNGRVLSGLLVEDSAERVVLKMQGGKLETIPRDDVEVFKVSKLSLMPEGVEKQLKPEEIADLFAFLALDKPPGDPNSQPIPGGAAVIGKRR